MFFKSNSLKKKEITQSVAWRQNDNIKTEQNMRDMWTTLYNLIYIVRLNHCKKM